MTSDTALSFVRDGKRGRCWWAIDPPSDYSDGWCLGEDLGLELMEWATKDRANDLGFVLYNAAKDQGRYRSRGLGHRGAILGFWRAVSWFALDRAKIVDFAATAVLHATKRAASDAALAAEIERQRKDASDRARHAAQARWAKKAA